MHIEMIRDYCLAKKGVTESFPFDQDTLVFKVMGKMFALTDLEDELQINLKCDPDDAVELRAQFDAVIPGFHMNKQHWNTVEIDGSIDDKLIYKWIDNSYNLVVSKLTKALREELEMLAKNNANDGKQIL